MVKEGSKSGRAKRMVAGVEAKTVRTLPLLWDKWKYAGIKEILYSDLNTGL